jgi:hypothetical protein
LEIEEKVTAKGFDGCIRFSDAFGASFLGCVNTSRVIATYAVQAHARRAIDCGSYAEQLINVKELLRRETAM